METAEKKQEEKQKQIVFGSFLKDEILDVKPIESSGKWSNLLVSGQEGRMLKEPFLFSKIKRSFQVPLNNQRNGGGVTIILDDLKRVHIKKYHLKYPEGITEKEFFENELGVDLNPYAKEEDNFWRRNRQGRVTLTKEGITLNLNKPLDMLRYKILLSRPMEICRSYEDRHTKATYEFMIINQGKITSKRVEEADLKTKAFVKYSEITSNSRNMKDFIKSTGKTIPMNHNDTWLKSEILTILENSPVKFMNIVNDPNYKAKIFVQNAIEVGAIKRMNENRYVLDNGIELGDLIATINYLADPENQPTKARIKARIELANK